MKIIFFVLSFIILMGGNAVAKDIDLSWKASQGADGYKIEQSLDMGTTWTEIKDAGDVLNVTVSVPDDILVLIRYAAYNSIGTTWRLDAGTWYNGSWKPVPPPSGIGIE